jgi:hypothetical protein
MGTAQVDREHLVPLLDGDAREPEPADADADVQHEAVQPAHRAVGLADHAGDVALALDVGLDRERRSAFARDLADRLLGARAVRVGDGHAGALAREEERHGAPVADRIRRRVEHPLSSADDEDPASREPAAAGSLALRLRARRPRVAFRFRHSSFSSSSCDGTTRVKPRRFANGSVPRPPGSARAGRAPPKRSSHRALLLLLSRRGMETCFSTR